jgi:hypothetical protein
MSRVPSGAVALSGPAVAGGVRRPRRGSGQGHEALDAVQDGRSACRRRAGAIVLVEA